MTRMINSDKAEHEINELLRYLDSRQLTRAEIKHILNEIKDYIAHMNTMDQIK